MKLKLLQLDMYIKSCKYIYSIGYVLLNAVNVYSTLVDIYISQNMLMYTVKLVHLLLTLDSERDKFCS